LGEGGFGFLGEFVAEEDGEGFGEFAADGVVVVDVERLEERLVDEPPYGWACREVRVVGGRRWRGSSERRATTASGPCGRR
jgi:hypothetical protein